MTTKIAVAEQPVIVSDEKNISAKSTSFRRNDYEKSPAQDEFSKKKDTTLRNAIIGTGVAVLLAVLADYAFAHGKHVKKLLGIAEKETPKSGDVKKPKTEPKPKPPESQKTPEVKENKDYENWLKEQEEAKNAIEESNKRNEEWVASQHTAREREYSDFWNNSLAEYERECTTFTHNGNTFTLSPSGEIISYKNSAGDELIGKYRNPISEGDKIYQKVIDEQKNLHFIEMFNSEVGKPARDAWFAPRLSLENGKTVITVTPRTEYLVQGFMNEVSAEIPEQFKKEAENLLRTEFEKLELTRELRNIKDEETIIKATEDFQNNIVQFFEGIENNEAMQSLKTKIEQYKANNALEAQRLLNSIGQDSIKAREVQQRIKDAQAHYNRPFEKYDRRNAKNAEESASVFESFIQNRSKTELFHAKRMYYGTRTPSRERIERYVKECGTFTPVDKTVTINGETVKIIYEGNGVDITEHGELLQKVFVTSNNKLSALDGRYENLTEKLVERANKEEEFSRSLRSSSKRKQTNKQQLKA